MPVLRELYDRMATRPGKVDLEAVWKKLGVARQGDKVTFDDQAPLAKLRLAMTNPRHE